MADFKTVPDPVYRRQCRNCIHWLQDNVVKSTPVNGQWHPVASLIAQGAMTSDTPVRDVAACTANPMWISMDSEHWCGLYEGRRKH